MKYFSLTNDPDHGKTDDYRKILRMLAKNGIFVTTAVFCKLKDDNSSLSKHCFKGETNTLEDTDYRDLMIEAKELGHEIAYHGYSQVSDTRDEFKKGLEIFRNIFGEYPKVYFEHGGHASFHPTDKVKKENLSFFGSDKTSKYFVKDIIKNVFDVVWTHDYLMDNLKRPLPLKEIFVEKDGITYLNRWRMYHFNDIKYKSDSTNNVVVGYTHFGYEGYKRSGRNIPFNIYKNYINKNGYYERWIGRDLIKVVGLLKNYLSKNNVESLTVSELFNRYNCEKYDIR